jgi:ATP-dependent Clp protease protease subunit
MKLLLTLLLTFAAVVQAKTIKLTPSNTVTFRQAFDGGYVAQKQLEILLLSATNGGEEIFLVLDTPGGSVSDGALFIDTINALDIKISTVTIFAASMGYITAQNLNGKRYIIPSGTLMSHRASIGGIAGQLPGEANTRLKYYGDFVNRLSEVAAKRVGISYKKYMKLIQDEYWVVGQSAVDKGHADEVVDVVCSKELTDLRASDDVKTPFGVASVQYSACPLISTPLKVSFGKGSNVPQQMIDAIGRSWLTRIRGE